MRPRVETVRDFLQHLRHHERCTACGKPIRRHHDTIVVHGKRMHARCARYRGRSRAP